ncbi:hypothetical protein Tsubulata_008009 [Turnera subulata]|uniref:Uncharacterized protein n=1 Tax=Turnera subulata TaxID=218843 RepID=A0A9Q0J9W9_9ROSI|nr:hypothetical protein Tsubulata_008009 [Turnera subulata]
MEGRKQPAGYSPPSSPSTLTSELFGSRDSPTSSAGIFGSMFAPSTKVLGRESLRSEPSGRKQDSANETLNAKSDASEATSKRNEGDSQSMPSKDMSSYYQEQRVQPCHLCSSIYYGGQDIYNQPQNNQSSSLNSTFKKDGPEDDAGSASRGNWWQGSLYY